MEKENYGPQNEVDSSIKSCWRTFLIIAAIVGTIIGIILQLKG